MSNEFESSFKRENPKELKHLKGAKLRHKLTVDERFRRKIAQTPGENPVLPAVMHSLKRYLKNAQDLSPVDQAVQTAIKESHIRKSTIETLVNNWEKLSDQTKKLFVPAELMAFDEERKIDVEAFKAVVVRATKNMPMANYTGPIWTNIITANSIVQLVESGQGLQLLQGFSVAAKVTSITPTEPDGYPCIRIGSDFTVNGTGFSTKNEDNLIGITTYGNVVTAEGQLVSVSKSIVPYSSQPNQLKATCPTDIPEGKHTIFVKNTIAPVVAFFVKPLDPPPTIITINPASQYSGNTVKVIGSGFGADPIVLWNPGATEEGSTDWLVEDCQFIDKSQIIMTVPTKLPPGQYQIAFASNKTEKSQWKPFTILPFKYECRFTKINCWDESDPEWAGDDEIVTQWKIVVDGFGFSKGTGQYSGFDDSTRDANARPYLPSDQVVYYPGNGPSPISKYLFVSTDLWEWDAGDADSWNEAFGFMGDCAKTIGSMFGPIGELIGEIVGYILKAIGWLISLFGGDPDALGTRDVLLTAVELFKRTDNPTKSFEDTLYFMNDDSTGSYYLNYLISRTQ